MNFTTKAEINQPPANQSHQSEWEASAIDPTQTALNLKTLTTDAIAEWYFQYLPKSARRNDGRISTGFLNAYDKPMEGGWGMEGYDPTDWDAEPELRCFKPDNPRRGKDGKPIKYDMPKNSRHNPILGRVCYKFAFDIFRRAGLNPLKLIEKYEKNPEEINETLECKWFWRAVADHPQVPISLSEGGKKAQGLLSQGRCSIGITSITTWRAGKGVQRVHPWLALFAQNRHFYIVFDQDIKKATIKAVNRQSVSLGASLIKEGASRVKRISWSGREKGIDDFIAKLTAKYGVKSVRKILDNCFTNARDYLRFEASTELPGIIKKVNTRYLSLEQIPEAAKAKILVVKSGKGTNKTGLLSELILSDQGNGIANLNISYLTKLAIELSVRLGIPYRTDKDTTYLRNSIGYSLCLDSFSPFNSIPLRVDDWKDAGLSLDEFTQVLQHGVFGTTEIKKFRKVILRALAQKIYDCWINGKPIRLLDADANLESIELIYDLIQLYSNGGVSRGDLEAETLTVINEYQIPKGDLHFYNESKPKAILLELRERMEKGENLLLVSSSQTSYSQKGTKNLEKMARKFYKDEEILRIDSKTSKNPNHPAFNLSADQLIKKLKNGAYKVIIGSPSICTGIDLSGINGIFDAVFSLQSGNISTNAVRQQLVRWRDFLAPRYVWVAKTGLNWVGSKSTNPIELLTNEKNKAQFTFSCLDVPQAENLIASNICPFTKYWANIGAKINAENYYYRETLIADLEAEGWNVIIENPDPECKQSKEAWEECREIKKESEEAARRLIDDSPELSKAEAEKIDRSPTQTEEQAASLSKFKLKEKYCVDEIDVGLIEADQKQRLYPALRLRFWLTAGRAFLEDHDREVISKHRERNNGDFFIPDINKSTNILKVKALEVLRPYLSAVQKEGKEWSNKSPKLKQLKKFVLERLIDINRFLKCGIAKDDSPITIVQKILKVIGLKLTYLRNERDGKKRLRIYGAAVSRFGALHHLENEIFEGWLQQEKRASLRRASSYRVRDEDVLRGGAA